MRYNGNREALLFASIISFGVAQYFPDYYYTDYQTLLSQQQAPQTLPQQQPQQQQQQRVYCSVPFGDFPHLADRGCKTFYHCDNFIPSVKACDLGLLFDFDNSTCVDYTHVKCEQQRQMYALRLDSARQRYDAANTMYRQQRTPATAYQWTGYPQQSYPQYRSPGYRHVDNRPYQQQQPVVAYNHIPAINPPSPDDNRETVIINLSAQPQTNRTQCALIEQMSNHYFAAIVQHATGKQCLTGRCSIPYLSVRCP